MKKIFLFLVMFGMIFLFVTGCQSDDHYLGKWYGTLATGEKVEVSISKTEYKIKSSSSDRQEKFTYKQFGKGFRNKTRYYSFKITGTEKSLVFPDDSEYSLVFPSKGYKEAMLMKVTDSENPLYGEVVQVLGKEDYLDYKKTATKYLK